MSRGLVYLWSAEPARGLYGRLTASVVPLSHLDDGTKASGRLSGRFVCVRNAGAVYEPGPLAKDERATPLGDARPNAAGNFLFEPGRGGGRIDKAKLAKPDFRWRYIQASRFGEVNTYFHIDRIATYVHDLLGELGSAPLPRVTAVVTAHHAATEQNRIRDGVRRSIGWLPFQGGHYRLPSRRYEMPELNPISSAGEIHLGPGRELLEHGALVEAAGGRYRANASHNAGIIYHEYGHHITRHTADFRANHLCPSNRQNNRKTAMDEGTCDYWAATMLGTPHIWVLHRRHDDLEIHVRSLTSRKTMENYDSGPRADVHSNGTIWGAALWDLRTQMTAKEPRGIRKADLLVLKALVLMGKLTPQGQEMSVASVRLARKHFDVGLTSLLLADEQLNRCENREIILGTFGKRGIQPAPSFHEGRHGELFLGAQMEHQRNAAEPVGSRAERES
jgi:Fungalysin metallopeptidase (M36)